MGLRNGTYILLLYMYHPYQLKHEIAHLCKTGVGGIE